MIFRIKEAGLLCFNSRLHAHIFNKQVWTERKLKPSLHTGYVCMQAEINSDVTPTAANTCSYAASLPVAWGGGEGRGGRVQEEEVSEESGSAK